MTARLAMNKLTLTAPTIPGWGPSGRRRAVNGFDSMCSELLFIEAIVHAMNNASSDLPWKA